MRQFRSWSWVMRLLGLAMAAALAACTAGGTDTPGAPSTGSPSPPVSIDWGNRPTETLALDGGFGVIACPGDAPFLCVERDGTTVGQVEHLSFPAPEGDPDRALRGRIEDDYRTFRSNREGCREGYSVETVEPEEADVAGQSGLRSEYSVVDDGGDTVERWIKYWLIDGDQLHLLSAEAQEEGTCSPAEGSAFNAGGLEEFESSFEIVAQSSRFPEAG